MKKNIEQKNIFISTTLFLFFFPILVKAQNATILTLIEAMQKIIEALVPLMVGLGLVGFLYGLVIYIFKAGDEDASERGKRIMFWGVIALFMMVSIWGIVSILQKSILGGTGFTDPPPTPTLPTSPGGVDPGGGGCDPKLAKMLI
ncbi:MAG: hypothetical protein U5L75_00260 [Candidatus Campbellbacteria bacterium]|nr:hypothetical protein [Candidatus Campbellbacteria bacterium]